MTVPEDKINAKIYIPLSNQQVKRCAIFPIVSAQPNGIRMLTDQNGLDISTDNKDAIKAINAFQLELVSSGKSADNILKAAEQYKDCAMIQAYAASLFLFNQSEQDLKNAEPYLDIALKLRDSLTEHEKLFIDAIQSGLALNFMHAIEIYEKIAEQWPTDIASIKLMEFHCFETGESERQLAFMQKTAKLSALSHVYAMYAFACELNNQFDESEKAALEAIKRDRNTPWAFHCLAHTYFNQGHTAKAIKLLEDCADVRDRSNNYSQSHIAFHQSLFYFYKGRTDDALKLFDSVIWGSNTDSVLQHTDAILFLWCADILGINVDQYWQKILPHIKEKAFETVFPFLNAMYIYALARGGEKALAIDAIKKIDEFADQQKQLKRIVWHNLGVPLINGVYAFASQDFETAAQLLEPLWQSNKFGGSDEQRIPLMWSYIQSLIAYGDKDKALAAITLYLNKRKPEKIEQRWLDQLQ